MSDMAKKARAAMKAKAKSLSAATDPKTKVDSSTWTPPEPLNTTAKTGMRPLSRRAFKAGGKVQGEKAKCNMGRAARKSGGSAEAKQWMNAKINRNVKDANEEREGIKHVGGMKKGGRAGRDDGGRAPSASMREAAAAVNSAREAAMSRYPSASLREAQNSLGKESRESQKTYKKGGRTKKQAGGGMYSRVAAQRLKGINRDESMEETIAKRQSTLANIERQMGTRPDEVSDRYYGQGVTPDPGYKKGGRTAKQNGGGMSSGRGILTKDGKDVVGPTSMPATEEKKAPPMPQRPQREPEKGMTGAEASEFMKARKSGGRTKKADGGDLSQYGRGVSGAAEMMKKAQSRAGVPQGLYGSGFTRAQKGTLSPLKAAGMKKGGEAKHPDEKMDIALIKKMVKPEARKAKKEGGFLRTLADRVVGDLASDEAKKLKDKIMEGIGGNMNKGGRAARKEGGGVFSGPGYPGKIPGVVPGGREAHARGGKTRGKGKTNINIVIAAGKPADQGMMGGMPGGPTKPPGMDGGPAGMPIPVPPPQAAGAAPMPMPIPMPMPAAGGATGPMPTPRKSGGRLTKVASSYKDMEAGSGGGEGRLQKTDIAKKHKDAPAFRRGGKAYRSYKDMDAGAGSGMGRLEKTEIQARKG